jgi:hypothetical protein
MAITWITANGLWPLLDGGVRIVVVNASTLESRASVTGAVVALHGAEGPPRIRRLSGSLLEAGDSVAIDDERPAASQTIGVEAVVRVLSVSSRVITDVYLRSDETRVTPIDTIEIGLTDTPEGPVDGVTPIGEIDGLSAYLRLEP